MTSVPPVTESAEFSRRLRRLRLALRADALDWSSDGLHLSFAGYVRMGGTRLQFAGDDGHVAWPPLMTGGVTDLDPRSFDLGTPDALAASLSAQATLVKRDKSERIDLSGVDVGVPAVAGGYDLDFTGKIAVDPALIDGLSDGVWDVFVSLRGLGLDTESSIVLPISLMPTQRPLPVGTSGRNVTPYVSKAATLALAVGVAAPAGLTGLPFDMLNSIVSRTGGTTRVKLLLPALASPEGARLRLTNGKRVVEADASVTADGWLTADVADAKLPAGVWSLAVQATDVPKLPIDGILLVPTVGPLALLIGSPTPPSENMPTPRRSSGAGRSAGSRPAAGSTGAAGLKKTLARNAAHALDRLPSSVGAPAKKQLKRAAHKVKLL